MADKKQFLNTKSIVKVETGIVTRISYRHYLKTVGNNKLWPDMQKESWNIHLTKIFAPIRWMGPIHNPNWSTSEMRVTLSYLSAGLSDHRSSPEKLLRFQENMRTKCTSNIWICNDQHLVQFVVDKCRAWNITWVLPWEEKMWEGSTEKVERIQSEKITGILWGLLNFMIAILV